MLKRASILLLILIILYTANAFLSPYPKKNVPEGFRPKYGVSYSFEQASWYGYDGRAEFVKLLDEVRFDWVRLPFFWDYMTSEDGQFNKNFDDLEFAVGEAQKRNIKVIVALGLKVPYYPEYHLPPVVAAQIKFGTKITLSHAVADDVVAIDKKVVERLSKYDNISYWQVENEPYLANVNNWKIGEDLIRAEIATVRNADPARRPIILNHVGPAIFDREWKGLLELLQEGDAFSANAYFKTQGIHLFAFSILGHEFRVPWPKFLVWPVQSWHGFSPNFVALDKQVKDSGKSFWIMEMQAEPYIRNLDDARGENNYFSATDVIRANAYLKSNRVGNVGFWGANYWIYRQKIGDNSWIEAAKSIVN